MLPYKKIIITKYMPPTHTRGSRIKAIESGGHSIVMSFSSELDVEQNHTLCAQMLTDEIYKNREMTIDSIGGFGPGYVFTLTMTLKNKGEV
jgi:hypothetical protein